MAMPIFNRPRNPFGFMVGSLFVILYVIYPISDTLAQGTPPAKPVEKRALTPRDRQAVASPDAVENIIAKLEGRNIADREKKARKIVSQGLAAIRTNNGEKALKKIEELRALYHLDDDPTSAGDVVECKDKCKHLLDEGNAPGYAVCWYACLIFGADGGGKPGAPSDIGAGGQPPLH